MKPRLAVLILAEMVLLLALFSPYGINRQSAARAWHSYRESPSSDTADRWHDERQRLRQHNALLDAFLSVLLLVNTVALGIQVKRLIGSHSGLASGD
jgi:hypothetical protein